MKEGRKPEYPEKTPDDEPQNIVARIMFRVDLSVKIHYGCCDVKQPANNTTPSPEPT